MVCGSVHSVPTKCLVNGKCSSLVDPAQKLSLVYSAINDFRKLLHYFQLNDPENSCGLTIK